MLVLCICRGSLVRYLTACKLTVQPGSFCPCVEAGSGTKGAGITQI